MPEVSLPVDESVLSCQVHSIAIQTASFRVSYEFYTKVLGLRVIRPPFRFKSRTLAWLDGEGTLIELYSVKPDVHPAPYNDRAIGVDHVAFVVKNLDLVAETMLKHGAKITKGPFVPPSGDSHQPRVLFVEGPDGVHIQFREV
jgi:catechol 2,3-dioxygenase-like lactoylglutathione lyase family enzyme